MSIGLWYFPTKFLTDLRNGLNSFEYFRMGNYWTKGNFIPKKWTSGWELEVVFLDLLIQRFAVDAQNFSRAGFVSIGLS